MLVKFINENSVRLYNGVVEIDSVMYANDLGKAKEAGFLPLVTSPKPDAREDECYIRKFELGDNFVTEKWEAVIIPEEEC